MVRLIGWLHCVAVNMQESNLYVRLHDKEVENTTGYETRKKIVNKHESTSIAWSPNRISFRKVSRKLSLHTITLMSNVLAWQHIATFSFLCFVLCSIFEMFGFDQSVSVCHIS